ncbi:MAG: 16S rRNA (guanine(966)-N(2))-methyltransferase RsmD [Anderseniella sp.]|nr:16S rRNA (guanine(966)-N(2))-methyltransferase RsmD [Anderseniella sp.]
MRIVGGKFRGRTIHAPDGRATRPTTDRVREAIFNRLEHGVAGFSIDGARVLDLFAGTGALGLEALSRGARHVLFIDDNEAARGLIRRNADELGAIGQVKLWRRDAAKLGPCAPMSPFGLVFLDPPYGKELADKALAALVNGGWLAPGAVIVVEEAAKAEPGIPPLLEVVNESRYGDTRVLTLRFGGDVT